MASAATAKGHVENSNFDCEHRNFLAKSLPKNRPRIQQIQIGIQESVGDRFNEFNEFRFNLNLFIPATGREFKT